MLKAQKIPPSVRLRMGTYKVDIYGVSLRVHVASCQNIVDQLVERELYAYVNQQLCQPVVVGIDSRSHTPGNLMSSRYVVLCIPNNYCLVVHIDSEKLPTSLKKFVEYHEKICLIGAKAPHMLCHCVADNTGIKAADFAARVRKETSLYDCENVMEFAKKVGIGYDQSISGVGVVGEQCKRYWGVVGKECKSYWDDHVFSDAELSGLVYNPYVLHMLCRGIADNTGIKAGDFAARVGKETCLHDCENVMEVAKTVGIGYDQSISGVGVVGEECKRYWGVVGKECKRYWDDQVFSDAELRDLVYNAYICCKIGQKLLNEPPS